MAGLLVTGTDTGVGKSVAAAALVRAARRAGLDVGAMKPLESGCGPSLVPADGVLLQKAAGGGDPLELVCPYRLEAPLAPGIAALREGREIDLDVVERAYGQLASRHADGVVVEGAGGLLVPLDPGFATVADLAARLALPLLVIARTSLGTINHTALTIEAIASRGLECRGVILSSAAGEDAEARANADAIEKLADVPVLAILPHVRDEAFRVERIADAIAGRKLDLRKLLS